MRAPTLADEEKLERIVNRACNDAYSKRDTDFKDDGVNWADLSFRELQTKPRPHVLVEEADPDAGNLREFIEGQLWKAGYDVVVRTAW